MSARIDGLVACVIDKSGGDLFSHLQSQGGKFNEERTKFYAAEIVLGLTALHSANIMWVFFAGSLIGRVSLALCLKGHRSRDYNDNYYTVIEI